MSRKVVVLIALAAGLLAIGFVAYANDTIAIHNPSNQAALIKFKHQSEEYCAKNLNKFGLYELQRYDAALDSLYKRELADTLSSIKTNYENNHQSRNTSIAALNEQIKTFTRDKEESQKRFSKLLRKAGLASLVWLIIIVILMQIRSRTLRTAQIALDNSASQVAISSSNFNLGKEILQFTKDQESRVKNQDTAVLDSWFLTLGSSSEQAEIQNKIKNIHVAAALNKEFSATIMALEKEPQEEKAPADLNQLCEQCIDTVYYGMKAKDESFNCVIAKDLEKKLPSIKVVPESVSYLLLNVLNNAFQSVYERNQRSIKGYVPKVTISTRVLPRFTQIRIKDNGEGMTDEMITQIDEPYYSNRNPKESAGLGMYFAKKIISEVHKGEMKVESHAGDGTDVYLKFFTT
jgi:signal transduction histidine kinase